MALLSNYSIGIFKECKMLILAPPKCGSTFLFNQIISKLDPGRLLEEINKVSAEYHADLCVHEAITHPSDLESFHEFEDIMESTDWIKITILRDPVARFLSAVASKYFPSGLSLNQELDRYTDISRKITYKSDRQLISDFNACIQSCIKVLHDDISCLSHASPYTARGLSGELIEKFFDYAFSLDSKRSMKAALKVIGQRLEINGYKLRPVYSNKLNESPLKFSLREVKPNLIEEIITIMENDYRMLEYVSSRFVDFSLNNKAGRSRSNNKKEIELGTSRLERFNMINGMYYRHGVMLSAIRAISDT